MSIWLVVGAPGYGKTYLLQAMERKSPATCVVWDRLGHWADRPGRIVVRSGDAEAAALEAIRRAPCRLVLDEAHLALPTHGPPHDSALWEISRVGRQAATEGKFRRRGPVDLICATQRPSEVWKGLRNLLDSVWVGGFPPTIGGTDLDWIAQAMGRASKKAKVALYLQVTSLPKPRPAEGGRPAVPPRFLVRHYTA